ncbi:MAG: GlxA family transcriptional regulator [Granulosicoccaceae bacterium]
MNIDFSRYGVPNEPAQSRVGFFLIDTFGMLPFISALEALRAANRFSGQSLYSWHLYGENDSPAIANNAIEQKVGGRLLPTAKIDRLIICGPHEPNHYQNDVVIRALKQLSKNGVVLGALDTGTFLLAQAKLIGNRRCTVHWENLPGFVEAYPELNVSNELFEIDRNLFTCAGGDAALDMMLSIIESEHGKQLSAQVADLFIHTAIRRAGESQRVSTRDRTGVSHPGLLDCIELMEANKEQPLTSTELANMIGISRRQLERLFRAHLEQSPLHYYQQIRLKAARKLLEQTSMSVTEVASACGFSSTDHFSRRFKLLFGVPPRNIR